MNQKKIEASIKRLQTFEPPEGYWLAFSGGKDSVVIKALADMANVKYEAHYNVTSVDPPELVKFIKDEFPDVAMDKRYDKDGKQITMWNLIPRKKMPPTRIVRYCCSELKEYSATGRFLITGVRKAESTRRKMRGGVEFGNNKRKREQADPDNPDQEMIHICMQKRHRVLNPIIDWTDDDVWDFIHDNNLPYCKLYDEGFDRMGCIGCPMASRRRRSEFDRWPTYYRAYIRAFDKMLVERESWLADRLEKRSGGYGLVLE